MKDQLVIGSRGSKLALYQADWVKARLALSHPKLVISVKVIKTSGDILKDAPLASIGGKGVFTKELEDALRDGSIDLAVHSLKDLPTTMPAGLTISTIAEREDPRDALVVRQGLELKLSSVGYLPKGCVVGTSSPRRASQLKHLRADLIIKDLRGNVDTRLRKLDSGDYDVVVLAAAGLRRLGLVNRIGLLIEVAEMIPAVGQGALAIETRTDEVETASLLAPLEDFETRAACTAERAFLRTLGGGCELPIAAHGVIKGDSLLLHGLVADASGERIERASAEGRVSEAASLGELLATQLLERGASDILPLSHRNTSS